MVLGSILLAVVSVSIWSWESWDNNSGCIVSIDVEQGNAFLRIRIIYELSFTLRGLPRSLSKVC